MSAYLYPELASKTAYRKALAEGVRIVAKENSPWGGFPEPVEDGQCSFEGPHYPKPHKYWGTAIVKEGVVVSVK